MNRCLHFGQAVSHLLVSAGAPPAETPPRRPHLHFVVAKTAKIAAVLVYIFFGPGAPNNLHVPEVLTPDNLTLAEFIDRPGTATMVVDTFIHSHGTLAASLHLTFATTGNHIDAFRNLTHAYEAFIATPGNLLASQTDLALWSWWMQFSMYLYFACW